MSIELLHSADFDVAVVLPAELRRVVSQGINNIAPWHIMDRDLAKKRMGGMRARYRTRYVPFARRQDNDDLACLDPGVPGQVVIVHDFASDGSERATTYGTFWDWFRAAVEEMIAFE